MYDNMHFKTRIAALLEARKNAKASIYLRWSAINQAMQRHLRETRRVAFSVGRFLRVFILRGY